MNEFESVSIWHKGTVLEELSAKLIKRGFNPLILNTIDTIKDFISKTIPVDATVGLGGFCYGKRNWNLKWYRYGGHLEKRDIETKLIEVQDDNEEKELFKTI